VRKFSELEPREKKMIALGAAAFAVMALYLLFSAGGPDDRGADKRKVLRTRDAFMADFAEYRKMAPVVSEVERMLERTPEDYDLYGELSDMVDDLNLGSAVKSMKRHQSTRTEYYRDDYVDVDLQRIKLDHLVELLKKIESSSAFLRVDRMVVKRRFSEEGELDVSMRVAAYSTLKEDAVE